MKQLFLLVCILLLTACATDRSAVAKTEWKLLTPISAPDETFYIEAQPINLQSYVWVYVMYDYDIPHELVRSSVEQVIVDCSSSRLRSVYIANYDDNLATGKVLFAQDINRNFYPAEQGTLYGDLWKAACRS